ncbi:MAG: Lpg1974 family pore-forming outer membrane protein [Gammaproteobacteria bacterium]
MKTKITLALAMIGLSAAAFAGAPGNQMVAPTGTPVIAPDSTGTWSFGLEALYMMSNTNFQYATVNDGADTNHNQSVNGDWNWGGEADISYMFPGSSRDVAVSYTYLNQDGGTDHTNGTAGSIIGVIGSATANDPTEADGWVDQTLNAATLTFGQLLTVGDRLSLHPFGGVQFADIDTTNRADYEDATVDPDVLENSYKGTSDFEGAGLRAGFDTSVHLGNGFSIVGTFAGALLVGSMDSKFDYNDFVAGTSLETKNDSYTALVPELDAKIGLDYMYAFNPNTSMNIQLGYEFVNYFNAESNDAWDSFIVNSNNNTSDFNYNGAYLRLQLNVA